MITFDSDISDGLNLAPDDILLKFGLEDHGRVQKIIDQSVIDFCNPYVPASPAQILKGSAQIATDIGSGEVVWATPYAHYQYMGVVYGPNFPEIDPATGVILGWKSPPKKYPTDRSLTYDTTISPLAGPFWFERMKADHLNEILDLARAAVREGGE